MREEFEKLRRAVVAGEVGAVIVYRVCRLSRDALNCRSCCGSSNRTMLRSDSTTTLRRTM